MSKHYEPGKIHTELFDQGRIWVDIRGNQRLLNQMDRSHIGNVIAYLLRNARRFQWVYYTDNELGEPPEQTLEANAVLWLLDKPLMKELLARWTHA